MNSLNHLAVRIVRWTGWTLLPLLVAFFATGYAISGRYGMGALVGERTALACHKLLHLPLAALVVAHVVPSLYLALIRWGWIKPEPKQ